VTSQSPVLAAALACARRGWPVFPCHPGRKTPATAHGHLDATVDERQIGRWFGRHPDRNLAIATGAPGPDVLDVDQHGPAGNGYAAFRQLRQAGLLDGAAAYVRTPGGGLHAYFTGTTQRSSHLPGRHLDFRAAGGYILAPPSRISSRPYQLLTNPGGHGTLDWAAVTALIEPGRTTRPSQPRPAAAADIDRLAAWVARQDLGNRNAGLFWAANRALESGPDADLGPLADAARHAGLDDTEIAATLRSARTTTRRPRQAGRQAEEAS
jgi:hypothetical protein